jgi:hypothetical protein
VLTPRSLWPQAARGEHNGDIPKRAFGGAEAPPFPNLGEKSELGPLNFNFFTVEPSAIWNAYRPPHITREEGRRQFRSGAFSDDKKGGRKMRKLLVLAALFLVFCSSAFALTAVSGKVERFDRTAKTVVVKTADGTEHTFHFVGRTAVHGTETADAGTKDSFHGLREGSDVVVHYTAEGTEETAEEIDHVGEGGLKTTEGTVTHLDRGAKTVTIKTADGTEQAFHLTDRAAEDGGKDVSEGAEKSGKVTVYYTEKAGHKVAHFFSKTL